jgi:hypothetical protein
MPAGYSLLFCAMIRVLIDSIDWLGERRSRVVSGRRRSALRAIRKLVLGDRRLGQLAVHGRHASNHLESIVLLLFRSDMR